MRYAAILSGRVVGVLDVSTPPTSNVPAGMTFVSAVNVPEVGTGWFYANSVFTEGTVNQKQQFIVAMQAHMTELALVIQKSQALVSAFIDRSYDAAAADPVTDADLQAFGVIQFDLGAAVNMLQALSALAASPVNEATVSKWRQL